MNRLKLMYMVILMLVTIIGSLSDKALSLDLPESMYISEDNNTLVQKINSLPGLYDETIVRTINLEFKQDNWWQQLEANYNSKTDIPADLTLDGVTYPAVGIRFRGNTSYVKTGDSEKKSFNISIDYEYPDQRLMDYKTLNLINCNSDPSFIREVLYFNICRNYIPCAKANFIKLTINGENWGIYANVQQLNNDFIEEWFLSSDGDRWKADLGDMNVDGNNQDNTLPQGDQTRPRDRQQPPGGGGGGFASGDKALCWLGNDAVAYEQAYDLKSSNTPEPWQNLITTCNVLNNIPLGQLADTLDTVLDIDRSLWFLAIENVCTDQDSYLTKGADYVIYYEVETGRIVPLEYDGNEAFSTKHEKLNPFEGEDNENRPLISRLLSVPRFRQRYLAHMRTIIEESFDWDILKPKIEAYQSLISDEVKADTKKLYSTEEFENSFAQLRTFIENRRNFLINLPIINRPAPEINSVSCTTSYDNGAMAKVGKSSHITAEINGPTGIREVMLHYAEHLTGPFDHVIMFDDGLHGDGDSDDGLFGCEIPLLPAGGIIRYYVEARAADEAGTTTYAPAGAEHDVFIYKVSTPVADSSPILINELMASNHITYQDPQGDYDDWIELLNTSDRDIDLSGMYLTDKEDNLLKWCIPEGTTLASGDYLIVWADEDGSADSGLHSNFKLSADGETILLVDTDERGNTILDSVSYGKQTTDISFGRYPDGAETLHILSSPTPGKSNEPILTEVSEELQPQSFNLMQNFPNPFNSYTVISFSIPESNEVDLSIYTLTGQKVITLAHGTHQAGTYQIHWDACNEEGKELASGIYVYFLRSGISTKSRSLLLLR